MNSIADWSLKTIECRLNGRNFFLLLFNFLDVRILKIYVYTAGIPAALFFVSAFQVTVPALVLLVGLGVLSLALCL